MSLILRILFKFPSWIILILAGAVFYGGSLVLTELERANRTYEAAAQLAPPQMSDFDDDVAIATGEVALRGRVFDNATYYFYYGDDGPTDLKEYFYFLEEPGAASSDGTFSAVLVFDSSNVEEVRAWWKSILVDPENDNDLAAIRGFASATDALAYDASEALAMLGGRRAENFVYIRPFLKGRDAFYQTNILPIDLIRIGFWGVIGVMILWAVLRFVIGKRAKAAPTAGGRVKSAVAAGTAAHGAAAQLMGEEGADDEDTDSEYGLALSIGKLLFGFLGKRRAADKEPVHADAIASEVPLDAAEPAPAAQSAAQRARAKPSIYRPHRQLYDENGLPIDLDELRAGDDVEECLDPYEGQGLRAVS